MRSRVTTVGRVIGDGLNQGEFVVCFPVGTRHFTLLQILEAGPFILCVLGVRPSLAVKRPIHKNGHAPPRSAGVKNERIYTSTFLYACVACLGSVYLRFI